MTGQALCLAVGQASVVPRRLARSALTRPPGECYTGPDGGLLAAHLLGGHVRPGRDALRLIVSGLVLALLVALLPLPAQAAELASYELQVDLDFAQGTAQVHEKVIYPNRTGALLKSIVFNATPAAFPGAFTLKSASAQGQPARAELDGVVLEVPLPVPLEQNATATIELTFELTLPRPGNLRFGKGDGIVALGNWYPVAAVYDAQAGDWDRHPYTDIGDAFYTEDANYTVTLDADPGLKIAHTGHLVSGSDGHWTYEAKSVRDFALAASDLYSAESQEVGGATIFAYYLPEHQSAGQQFLRSAVETVTWMNSAVGPYAYGSLFVAETATGDPAWVGQEYPGIVFIGNTSAARGGGTGSYVDALVTHEVIHQWFYSAVGDDQLHEPWLDEALTTFLAHDFYRLNHPEYYPSMWSSLEAAAQRWAARPVNTSIYDYTDESNYFGIVYNRGAVFLNDLRQEMGDDAFYGFLQRYYEQFSGRIASGRDFLGLALALSGAAGKDVRPLIQEYFTYPLEELVATPTPSPTPTATPTATATPSPIPSPTATATATPSPTATSTPADTPTAPAAPTVQPLPRSEVATPTTTPARSASAAESNATLLLSAGGLAALAAVAAAVAAYARR